MLKSNNLFKTAQKILASADIIINGDNPYDMLVHNDRFYQRVLSQGSLGLGESYVEGWWDCQRLDECMYRIFSSGLHKKVHLTLPLAIGLIKAKLVNLRKRSRSFRVGHRHYDLGNDLYKAMLDKRLVYTCGYWQHASNLDEAQEAKLDLICKKIGLKPGMRVLDVGCGWGSFAKYAAEKYNAHVVGITISQEQIDLGKQLCQGLPVELRLQDYRDINEPFDHIVSLGMFEHVGYKNYRAFMHIMHRCLKDNGLFLLHTIGGNQSYTQGDPWLEKYIFPNSMLPSIKQIGNAIEGLFIMEDWHNFSAFYDQTLMAWYHNFKSRWDTLKDSYNDEFYRMWTYYLLMSAGAFRARHIQLWQIVLTKRGVPGGYHSIR
jgi:cyclopropane-fatty-acyl-phospholipid synthase